MNPFPHSPNRYCRGKAESGLLTFTFFAMMFLAGLLFGNGPFKGFNAWMPERFWTNETRLLMLPPHLRPKPYYEIIPFKIPPGAQTGKK
jgi:hypothetical protein